MATSKKGEKMDFDINDILKNIESQNNPLLDIICPFKSDIEINCKITYSDIPSIIAHSSEMKQLIDMMTTQLKCNMAEFPGTKINVKTKIKDKNLFESK